MLDVDNGGGYACVGQGYMGNLYICLSFAVNKKTALKSNLYYKRQYILFLPTAESKQFS